MVVKTERVVDNNVDDFVCVPFFVTSVKVCSYVMLMGCVSKITESCRLFTMQVSDSELSGKRTN